MRAALFLVALLAASCSSTETIDLEPSTGIAATCESPVESPDGRWDNDVDALVFVRPDIAAGAIVTPTEDGWEESPAIAAGNQGEIIRLLEEAPAVARVEGQSEEDAYRDFRKIFDSDLIDMEPNQVPRRISVWADPDAAGGLPFRTLMQAVEARPDVDAVQERVGWCLRSFLNRTIRCAMPASVDVVLYVARDSYLDNATEVASDATSGSIEVVDREAALGEVAQRFDVDLSEGRLNTGDVSPSVRISNVGDVDATIEELTRRFEAEWNGGGPSIRQPRQDCD